MKLLREQLTLNSSLVYGKGNGGKGNGGSGGKGGGYGLTNVILPRCEVRITSHLAFLALVYIFRDFPLNFSPPQIVLAVLDKSTNA